MADPIDPSRDSFRDSSRDSSRARPDDGPAGQRKPDSPPEAASGAASGAARDPFAPPKMPCEVQCIHCGESFDSWQIEWRDMPDEPIGGAWCCPTPGCDGIGFGFDIFPVDSRWVDENGEHLIAQVDDDDEDDFEIDDEHFSLSDDDDDDDADDDGAPFDVFDVDAFWIDADRILPRPLGNSPQHPFNVPPPPKLFESSDGEWNDDDLPF